MDERERRVLQVLPHPGGGGETYVDLLTGIERHASERMYLAPGPQPLQALPSLIRTVPRANLRAGRFDILHVNGEVPALLCLPALARRPSVLTLHGLSLVRRSSGVAGRMAETNLRFLVRAASRTICVSDAEHARVLAIVGAGLADRVTLIPCGVPLPELPRADERASTRREFGVNDEVVVAWVGALNYPKDPVAAVNAVTDLAEAGLPIVLLVVGDGSLLPEVEAAARRSPRAVRVLGHRKDVARLLGAADMFLLTSRHEGLPFSLLEAMALGLPAVVSDYPGAHDAVGEAGIVASDDVELRAVLQRLGTVGRERLELGQHGRSRVAERFTLDAMLAATNRVYDEVAHD